MVEDDKTRVIDYTRADLATGEGLAARARALLDRTNDDPLSIALGRFRATRAALGDQLGARAAYTHELVAVQDMQQMRAAVEGLRAELGRAEASRPAPDPRAPEPATMSWAELQAAIARAQR